ncbi:hypothetical protein CDAR_586511 [Caerostris darwini]|uniref:Uncharacterized protein n=1 Tax=Caerostris darwini TaxID=1538125 RepID=A0AAV4QAA6_9ARAC|nr:hypothetical protein CDAR_586511 [Caerostris darwini]
MPTDYLCGRLSQCLPSPKPSNGHTDIFRERTFEEKQPSMVAVESTSLPSSDVSRLTSDLDDDELNRRLLQWIYAI